MSVNSVGKTGTIRAQDLADFLRVRGWALDDSLKRFWLLESPPDSNGNTLEVSFPRSEESPDFERRVREVLALIAELESTSPGAIASSIQSRRSDQMVFSIKESLTLGDGLPLDVARDFVQALSNSLAFSAMNELQPRYWYGRRSNRGDSYVSSCQFGHTVRGSFGFVVESPIRIAHSKDRVEQLDLGILPPFSRRVVERYARGFLATQDARTFGSADSLLDTAEIAWNGNVCDAVAEMTEAARGASVEFSVRWSSYLEPAVDLREFRPIAVSVRDVPLLESAVTEFRDEEAPQEVTIVGTVVENKSPGSPPRGSELSDEDYARQLRAGHPDAPEVTIREEGWSPARHIRASITYRQWQAAGAAQLQFKRVRIVGRLARQGNRWRLFNADRLEILDDQLDLPS